MKILKYSGFLCALGMLAGCGGGEPSKEEVKDYMIQQGLSQAFLFQHPSVEQRAKAVEQLNKAVDLQSYECKAVEGFKKVWDCKLNYMVNNQPQTNTVRFNRDDSGKIHGQGGML